MHSVFGSGSAPGGQRRQRRRHVPRHGGPGAPCRTLGLSARLARRAPQHAGHRERGHGTDGVTAQALRCSVVGSPVTVERGLRAFIERYQPDELMLTAMIHDHAERLRSFEIATQVHDRLAATA